MVNISYTGIGARKTPEEVVNLFIRVGKFLAKQGLILRSGSASGADTAFETGCNLDNGLKEIYLPWIKFEGSDSLLIVKDQKAFDIAAKYHPNWSNLSDGAKKLQARNSHQILGQDLNSPTNFVICWTKNGSGEGGTGQALRIAEDYNIPIFDAGKYKNLKECRVELNKFLKNFIEY